MTDTDLLIVGGGLHGIHLAIRLVLEVGWGPERMTILDPLPSLLDRWRRRTRAVGMTHLRSPDVHHVGVTPFELRESVPRKKKSSAFLSPYARPPLSVFNRHADSLVDRARLAPQHVRARALGARREPGGVRVDTTAGALRARRVVLALGRDARPLPAGFGGEAHRHVFSLGEGDLCFYARPGISIVGGGLSAAQVALRLLNRERAQRVTVVARHPPREKMFDADPGWLGPKYMRAFEATGCWERRRAQIRSARHRGSMPPEIYRRVRSARAEGRLVWRVEEACPRKLHGPVLFATGLEARALPEWVAAAADAEGLPRAPCGAPVPDGALRWGDDRIFVMGPLAELVVGPVAPNMAGARRAATRILAHLPAERRGASRVA